MRSITLALGGTLALSVGLAVACPDGDHAHEIMRRADPSVPLTPPSRPLVWGDVNIIHTTDSHGWLLGHQKTSFPEPNYRCVSLIHSWSAHLPYTNEYEHVLSGDFGDFASFVAHMKDIAKVGSRIIGLRESTTYMRLGEGRRLVVGGHW
jgi:2',3'-cyclic-nucleotide 2'-phosphodiesterase (5'-nucleotidase family)